MTRGILAFLFLFLASGQVSPGQEVRIGVLGLYHPRQLELRALRTEAVVVAMADQSFVLGPGSPENRAIIRVSGDQLLVAIHGREFRAEELRAAGRNGATTFVLSVPGKVSRRYHGTLSVSVKEAELMAIVAMDLETAVASVVQAESAPQTPIEALKAQAVVTRSYFVAGAGRHESYDFCDLAHCQVLREPPSPESPAARARARTHGLVLTYQERPFAAMFSRCCGGRTRTPAEIGLPVNGYPYFSVSCRYCRDHPQRWTRRISRQDAALLLGKGEAGRLALDHKLGWNAVPSNNFTARAEGNEVILEGTGQGHGIGLCQRGAKAMAAGGAGFRKVLSHYFPNAKVMWLEEREIGRRKHEYVSRPTESRERPQRN
jgi:stage II sporulation protein D (peptidoglycan lytic transglycosylase)